jgi:NAD dependent epimerase/dehydratase
MMNWKNKKVLVTGAGGFIGSHLTESLVSKGANVRAFVRYNSNNSEGFLERFPEATKKKIEIVKGDVTDLHTMQQAAKGTDVIFHLAASISVPYSFIHPYEVVRTNTMGTMNALQAAKDADVEKIVVTSSSETYGTALYSPIDEKHPLQTQSPYAASKAAGDKIAESYYRTYNLPVVVLRPFNTFGPRQSQRAVLPTIITQALTSNKIKVGAITPRRDWTFVLDTAEGFIKAAESEKAVGKLLNIGYGQDFSVGEAAQKVLKIIGRDILIESDEERMRPGNAEVHKLLADTKLARELINWSPHYTFDAGLKITIEWIKDNLQNYKVGKYQV